MNNTIDIHKIIEIAQNAGQLVMRIYEQSSFDIQHKIDKSVLTQADIESHAFIYQSLQKNYPNIPIISEESTEHHDYEKRKHWEYFFLVDPLDGTKEFIQRNGEFTINIALVKNNQPILGVINAPALNVLYYATLNKGAFKIVNQEHIPLPQETHTPSSALRVAISRSHACSETEIFLKKLAESGREVISVRAGSALKFGLIAEGKADIYPRFGPTMEWDTAAGHILIHEAGKKMSLIQDENILNYNKLELVNPGFIVQ
jgi:3'(2'), 5'-bisphosphate nucleotidase